MKQSLLILTFIFFGAKSYSQIKNYKFDNGKIEKERTISEETVLEISDSEISYTKIVKADNSDTQVLGTVGFSGVTTAVIGLISSLPEYTNQILEKRKKQFHVEYNAKNSFQTQPIITIVSDTTSSITSYLPELILTRSFYDKDLNKKEAVKLVLAPNILQNKYMAFSLEDLKMNYSKAKITDKFSFINLMITVKLIYTEKASEVNEKKEITSKPLIIPYSLNPNFNFDKNKYKSYFTDMFPLENIIEIDIKVEEINPKKIKIEDLQKILTDNNEDIKKILEAISESL